MEKRHSGQGEAKENEFEGQGQVDPSKTGRVGRHYGCLADLPTPFELLPVKWREGSHIRCSIHARALRFWARSKSLESYRTALSAVKKFCVEPVRHIRLTTSAGTFCSQWKCSDAQLSVDCKEISHRGRIRLRLHFVGCWKGPTLTVLHDQHRVTDFHARRAIGVGLASRLEDAGDHGDQEHLAD